MEISENESWDLLNPVCRELSDLVNSKNLIFERGEYNDKTMLYSIYLKSNHFHFASRGLRDSINDIEYNDNMIRIGLRSKGNPINLFIYLKK